MVMKNINIVFLKSIAKKQSPKRCKSVVKQSSKNQLKLLQTLLCAFIRGDINITKHIVNRLKKSRYYNFIIKNFSKITPQPNLLDKLSRVAFLLPLFIRRLPLKEWSEAKNL